MTTLKSVVSILILAAALPAAAAPYWDGASERAHADAAWMDGARASGGAAAVAGAEGRAFGSLLRRCDRGSSASSLRRRIEASAFGGDSGLSPWNSAFRWLDSVGFGDDFRAGFGESLKRLAKSPFTLPVMTIETTKGMAIEGYRKYGVAGGIGGAVAGAVAGAFLGTAGAVTGVVGNLWSLGRSLFGSKR